MNLHPTSPIMNLYPQVLDVWLQRSAARGLFLHIFTIRYRIILLFMSSRFLSYRINLLQPSMRIRMRLNVQPHDPSYNHQIFIMEKHSRLGAVTIQS